MRIKLRTIVVDCKDARVTADFYRKLLGWAFTAVEDGWILMRDPKGGTGLSFQSEEDYAPPVWPEAPGAQKKMLHMDFLVEDLPAAAEHALACGAIKAPVQFLAGVVVFFDPDGHPFCLFEDGSYAW
ncbi:MAG: VOC family protein [Christensenellales bacterium]|jgi:catechol 2,3-dioxygenase-like lactoylglutathione lyase family enzyme